MELQSHYIVRWATSNGGLTVPNAAGDSVSFVCGDVVEEATVKDGVATITLAQAIKLMPDLGKYVIEVRGDDMQRYVIERVESRYTSRDALLAYGKRNNDGFDNVSLYPLPAFDEAIQRAEEALEQACKRSFTTRKLKTRLFPAKLCELPVVDAQDLECDLASVELVSDRQAVGVTKSTMATITYGTESDSLICEAATRLAASYLRPSAHAENARGTSSEGVYISYTLPTGDEGSWTGIPYVDAAIEEHRSRRVIIA